MHSKFPIARIMMLAALAGGGGATTTTVHATDYTFDGGGGTCDWHTQANWDLAGVPNSVFDKATIPTGFTVCLNADATVGALDVFEAATVQIAPSSTATLTVSQGTATPIQSGLITLRASQSNHGVIEIGGGTLKLQFNDGPHQIGGEIILAECSSRLLIRGHDATFAPYVFDYGSIIGRHDQAKIDIGAGRKLTNSITIEGQMVIQPEAGHKATLRSKRFFTSSESGVVFANRDGTLKLAGDLVLEDESYELERVVFRPLWGAGVHAGARLEFNRAARQLSGNFVVDDCATLRFNQSVATCGQLSQEGLIDIGGGPSVCFFYNCGFTSICADLQYPNPCN